VQGDLLVDDKPRITGSKQQTWKHVIFSQSYNKDIEGKPRLSSWSSWRSVFAAAV
ncbi:unnamed protein product, partial [Symbiodinium pilosum]